MFKKSPHPAAALNAKQFEQLYSSHSTLVYRICYGMVKDSDLAKEMTQDIFMSIWERRDKLEITESFEQYLTRAAKLQVFQHYRKKASETKYLNHTREDICVSDNCTENQIFYNDLKEDVGQIIDRLPCRCREVYILSREKGLTNSEIASRLLISVKTVEKHLTKALATFKEILKV
jgi:RNA polymerase sigma-70 factor (family 1)